MLSRSAKAAFYLFAGPLMALNGHCYRLFRPRGGGGERVRLHLGPGREKYLPGWINIDANMFTGKCDLWADLTKPLPFAGGTVDAVYSHHVVEHLPDVERHFKDVYRILKPGGVYRLGGPNADVAIRMFSDGRSEWFYDWPEKYESIGGRFANFILCKNEHLAILTESFLKEMGRRAGFSQAINAIPMRDTQRADLFSDCLRSEHESTFDVPHTLIVEFTK